MQEGSNAVCVWLASWHKKVTVSLSFSSLPQLAVQKPGTVEF